MTEPRKFKDVFADIAVSDRLSKLLDTVYVERAIYNKNKKLLRIFLISDYWIKKKYIYEIEKAISDQVLLECGLEVTITERFRLSGQYVPEKF